VTRDEGGLGGSDAGVVQGMSQKYPLINLNYKLLRSAGILLSQLKGAVGPPSLQ